VHHPGGVDRLHRRQQLTKYLHRAPRRQPLRRNGRAEAAAPAELHGVPEAALVLAAPEHPHHRRVVDALAGQPLADEPPARFVIVGRGLQDLDGRFLSGLPVDGAPDRSHAALPDSLHQAVGAHLVAGAPLPQQPADILHGRAPGEHGGRQRQQGRDLEPGGPPQGRADGERHHQRVRPPRAVPQPGLEPERVVARRQGGVAHPPVGKRRGPFGVESVQAAAEPHLLRIPVVQRGEVKLQVAHAGRHRPPAGRHGLVVGRDPEQMHGRRRRRIQQPLRLHHAQAPAGAEPEAPVGRPAAAGQAFQAAHAVVDAVVDAHHRFLPVRRGMELALRRPEDPLRTGHPEIPRAVVDNAEHGVVPESLALCHGPDPAVLQPQ